jgi:thioredoxin 1
MNMQSSYDPNPLSRSALDALEGITLVEFGTAWCGHCQAVQPALQQALAEHPGLRHLKIKDGKGRPLGRSFRVKLWPTLILLRDGQELARLVRPGGQAIRQALAQAVT